MKVFNKASLNIEYVVWADDLTLSQKCHISVTICESLTTKKGKKGDYFTDWHFIEYIEKLRLHLNYKEENWWQTMSVPIKKKLKYDLCLNYYNIKKGVKWVRFWFHSKMKYETKLKEKDYLFNLVHISICTESSYIP